VKQSVPDQGKKERNSVKEEERGATKGQINLQDPSTGQKGTRPKGNFRSMKGKVVAIGKDGEILRRAWWKKKARKRPEKGRIETESLDCF